MIARGRPQWSRQVIYIRGLRFVKQGRGLIADDIEQFETNMLPQQLPGSRAVTVIYSLGQRIFPCREIVLTALIVTDDVDPEYRPTRE
jgi:hypothetical protein